MGKASRDKGKRGELLLARFLREQGYDCRRTSQYCGQTGDAADVVGLPGLHIECKFVERLNIREALEQAKTVEEEINDLTQEADVEDDINFDLYDEN